MNIITAIAESIIAICAIVALWQIKIAKEDIRIRSKREAITLAINQVEYCRSEIVSSYDQVNSIVLDMPKEIKDLRLYSSREFLEDFTLEELQKNKKIDRMITKISYLKKNNLFDKIISLANKFEYFSLAFIAKAADEEVAFNPIADILCDFVEEHYEIYCYNRREGNYRSYTNTIQLYKIWKARILMKKIDFKKETYSNEIREDLNKIKKGNLKNIEPVGIN